MLFRSYKKKKKRVFSLIALLFSLSFFFFFYSIRALYWLAVPSKFLVLEHYFIVSDPNLSCTFFFFFNTNYIKKKLLCPPFSPWFVSCSTTSPLSVSKRCVKRCQNRRKNTIFFFELGPH